MNTAMLLQIVQPIAVIVAALSILTGLRGVQKQIQVTTYLELTNRFRAIVHPLRRMRYKYADVTSLGEIHPDEADEFRELSAEYFNIIGSEFHLYRSGYVDKTTWHVWATGIGGAFKTPILRQVWCEVKPRYIASPRFQRFMDNKMAEADARFRP